MLPTEMSEAFFHKGGHIVSVMDGLAAARAIRQLPRSDAAHMPIIAMTANAFASDLYHSRQAGMNAPLGKPVDAQQLWKTLAEQLEKN